MPLDVLIVDDDPDIRGTLAELLRDEGYSVGELGETTTFCDVLAQQAPRLVLLDLTLPGQNLEKVLTDAHARGLLLHTCVLALSGLEETVEVANQLGLDGSLRKPFEIDDLLSRVHTICGSKESQGRPGVTDLHP